MTESLDADVKVNFNTGAAIVLCLGIITIAAVVVYKPDAVSQVVLAIKA